METAQTADLALSLLLELQADDGQTVAGLTKSMSINRSVVQRLVSTLHNRALIIRSRDGRYWLGPGLVALAKNLPHELARLGSDVMQRLADVSGATVVLAVPEGDQATIVGSVSGSNGPLRIEYTEGFRQSLAKGASGLAILAFLDEGDPRKHSLGVDPERLRKIREDGLALTEGEIRAFMVGMAVPVRTARQVVGSLALIVPSFDAGRLKPSTNALRMAAADLGSLYGPKS